MVFNTNHKNVRSYLFSLIPCYIKKRLEAYAIMHLRKWYIIETEIPIIIFLDTSLNLIISNILLSSLFEKMIISGRSFDPLINAINYWSQKPKLHLSTNAYKIPVLKKYLISDPGANILVKTFN